MQKRFWLCTVAPALAGALCGPARAQDEPTGLLGNMGGIRTELGKIGVTLGLSDSENLLGNVSGGVKQGATMQGVTTATLQMDTQKALGLAGGTFNVSALQIHGQNLSPAYLDTLQTANGNEAENATRLWELWYDQVFGASGFDLKIGQQSIDNEFMVSQYSGLFVNTAAGWPILPSEDLYAGGPAYPLASLGLRGQYRLTHDVTVLGGVFDDNPPGGAFDDDPQSRDGGGTRFNLNTGALFIAELQDALTLKGLPGTYKIGFWADTGSFPDQAVDDQGVSLASPDSDGVPAMHRGNYSIYGVVDQTIWQSKGARSVNMFARVMGAPAAQNLISYGFNGGVTLTAPLPGRDNDQAGIDIGLAKVSGQAAENDRAVGYYTNSPYPVRGTETLIELTYQAQVTPWLQLQPDLQCVIHPGAGVQNPNDPTRTLSNEIVAGMRASIRF